MFNPDDKQDNIDKVKQSLYSKNENIDYFHKRHNLQDKDESNFKTDWDIEEKPMKKLKIPYTKILIGSFIFFVLALGFTFFKFFLGQNIISGNNIDILVSGPVSVSGGEEFSLNVEVKNNNNVDLQVVDLQVEFPDGTRNTDDLSKELKRYSEILGSINVGDSEERIIKAVLFGEENSQ